MVPRKRHDTLSEKRPVLDAMGRCRDALIRAKSDLNPDSIHYAAIHQLTRAIDKLGEVLTGKDDFFHAGGSAQGSDAGKWKDSGW